MREIAQLLGFLVLGLALVVGGVYGYIYLFRDASPKYQEAQREVFVNTPSYVNGKIDELGRIKRSYEKASDPAVKKALREEALLCAGTVDNSKLPPSLRNWLNSL